MPVLETEPCLVLVGGRFSFKLLLLGKQAITHGDAIEDRIEHKSAHGAALMPSRLANFLGFFLCAAYKNSRFLNAWHKHPLILAGLG